MKWFRTIRGVVRPLVAAFLLAQLSGIIPLPRTGAHPIPHAVAAQADSHHAHDHGGTGAHHHGEDRDGRLADQCCALHAFFSGILPPAIAIDTMAMLGERLVALPSDHGPGIPADPLDRPPRPLALI